MIKKTLFIICVVLYLGCSNSTGSEFDDLADGEFLARVEDQSPFGGDAIYDIVLPTSEFDPEASQDSVLFLTLKTGEITWSRDTTEYTVYTGVSVSAFWDPDALEFEIGLTMYSDQFIDLSTITYHAIHSGTIRIEEKKPGLLAGNVEVLANDDNGKEYTITGKFRALRSD